MTRWAAIVLAGCALTSKSAPRELRYFSPEIANVAPAPTPAPPHARVRLGRIATGLRTAIIHRDSFVEVAPYETFRWTEPPDAYLRRAIAHALFAGGALEQATGGDAPTLDVELVAFEEVIRGTRHTGRIALHYELHDDHRVLARGEITMERAAAAPQIESVVPAIGEAMNAAASELTTRVAVALH